MHDIVDIAGLRRQQQHAEYGPETLDRYRNRNDELALFRRADNCAADARQRIHHFWIDGAVTTWRFLVNRKIAWLQRLVEESREPFAPGLFFLFHRRQIETQNL